MKNIKFALLNIAFVFSGIFGSFGILNSMDQTAVQKHVEWLGALNNESTSDVNSLVGSMCALSSYLDVYKEYNFLKKQKDALGYLKTTREIIKKLSSNVTQLSSNQKESFSLMSYRGLLGWLTADQEASTLSKFFSVYKAVAPQSLLAGQKLAKSLNYLNIQCGKELKIALKAGEVSNAITAMEKFSYNTQLLFSALNSKEILNNYVTANRCKDEKFLQAIKDIANLLYVQPAKKKVNEAHLEKQKLLQKQTEKEYADWIKGTFAIAATGLKITDEIASKPDISGLGYMFLKPSYAMKKAVPLIERYGWLRRLLGRAGQDIEMAMKNNMAPSQLMQHAKEKVPDQLKPLIIWLLENYGKTIINPLIWTFNKNLFPLRNVTKNSDLLVQDLQKYGKIPSLEDRLYPYLSKVGSSFYDQVTMVLENSSTTNPNSFETQCYALEDDVVLKKKIKFEKKYQSKKERFNAAQEKLMQQEQQLINAQNKSSPKVIGLIMKSFEDAEKDFKILHDSCFALEKKLRVIDSILKKRAFNELPPVENNTDYNYDNLGSKSLAALMYGHSLRLQQNAPQVDCFLNKRTKLEALDEKIKVKKDIILKVKNNALSIAMLGRTMYVNATESRRIKGLNNELHDLEQRRNGCRNKIKKIKQCYENNCQEIEAYDKAVNERMHEVDPRDYLCRLFPVKCISDELFAYYEELVVSNRKGFSKVVKKFYNPNNGLNSQKIQNVFNAWLIYLLDREEAYNKASKEEYINIIDQIKKAKSSEKGERKEYRKKNINEVWSSYNFRMKLAAWYHFLKNGDFPIFTSDHDNIIQSNKSLYKECSERYRSFSQEAPSRFVNLTTKNEIVQKQRQEQGVLYTRIKAFYDNEKSMPVKQELEVTSLKSTTKNAEKKESEPVVEFRRKEVALQNNAECGYHAVFNGLKSIGVVEDKGFDLFLTHNKSKISNKRTADERNVNDAQWLIEDEIEELLGQYPEVKNSVIFIPDVERYCDGSNGLHPRIINQLSKVHNDIDTQVDFKRAYIIGTGKESSSWTDNGNYNHEAQYQRNNAHWISIEQTCKDGHVTYDIMNSLNDWGCKELTETFKELMHARRGFRKLSLSEAEKLKNLVTDIGFSKAFYDGFYALNATKNGPEKKYLNGIEIINVFPLPLIDRILNASVELLNQTKGEIFHNCMGRIEPIDLVKKAIAAIMDYDGKRILLKKNSHDIGVEILIKLNEQQKEIVAELATAVGLR